jgi:hypothetical protein
MNREELEELINEYAAIYWTTPTIEQLRDYSNKFIDEQLLSSIYEDRWERVYGQGTINEGHWKSKGDYIK